MRRGLLRIVAATLVLLLGGEVAARALEDRLPQPLRYHSHEADVKVDRMDELDREGGAAVTFVGTSLVYGVDPSVLPASVSGRAAGYNAALGSGIPALAEPWSLHSVIPRLEPDLLVIGLTSYDLSDDPGALAFTDAYLSSDGAARDLDRTSITEDVDHWVGERSALWENRFGLRDPSAVLDAVRGHEADVVDPVAATLQPTGRPSFGQTQRFEDRQHPGGGDLSNWAIGRENVEAMQRLIRGARESGVEVALLNMPVTAEYIGRHPGGAADYASYLAFLGELAEDEDVTLVDLHDLSDHRYFADEVHLNLEGAQTFTGLLVDALRSRGLLDAILRGS